eukprot:Opistho-2@24722
MDAQYMRAAGYFFYDISLSDLFDEYQEDFESAKELMLLAVKEGHAHSTMYYGECLCRGLGLPQNMEAGLKVLEGMAVGEGRFEPAAHRLDRIYRIDPDLRKNPQLWFACLPRAKENLVRGIERNCRICRSKLLTWEAPDSDDRCPRVVLAGEVVTNWHSL